MPWERGVWEKKVSGTDIPNDKNTDGKYYSIGNNNSKSRNLINKTQYYKPSLMQEEFLTILNETKSFQDTFNECKLSKSQVDAWVRAGRNNNEKFVEFYKRYSEIRVKIYEKFKKIYGVTDINKLLKLSNITQNEFTENRIFRRIYLEDYLQYNFKKFLKLFERYESIDKTIEQMEIDESEIKKWISNGKYGEKHFIEFYNDYSKIRLNLFEKAMNNNKSLDDALKIANIEDDEFVAENKIFDDYYFKYSFASDFNDFLDIYEKTDSFQKAIESSGLNSKEFDTCISKGEKGNKNFVEFYDNYLKVRINLLEKAIKDNKSLDEALKIANINNDEFEKNKCEIEEFYQFNLVQCTCDIIDNGGLIDDILAIKEVTIDNLNKWFELGQFDNRYADFYNKFKPLKIESIKKELRGGTPLDNIIINENIEDYFGEIESYLNELVNEAINLFNDSKYYDEVLDTLDISEKCFDNWIKLGKDNIGIYSKLYQAYVKNQEIILLNSLKDGVSLASAIKNINLTAFEIESHYKKGQLGFKEFKKFSKEFENCILNLVIKLINKGKSKKEILKEIPINENQFVEWFNNGGDEKSKFYQFHQCCVKHNIKFDFKENNEFKCLSDELTSDNNDIYLNYQNNDRFIPINKINIDCLNKLVNNHESLTINLNGASKPDNLFSMIINDDAPLNDNLNVSLDDLEFNKRLHNLDKFDSNDLYLVFSFLKWLNPKNNQIQYAPLILIPIKLNNNKIIYDDSKISINPLLKNELMEYYIDLPKFKDISSYLINIKEIIKDSDNLELVESTLIDVFTYTIVIDDLSELAKQYVSYQDLLNTSVKKPSEVPVDYNNNYNIFNQLTTEYNLVKEIVAGNNLLINAADEFKYTMFSNLISELIANKNSVLYVSKNANPLIKQLNEVNLNSIYLDLFNSDNNYLKSINDSLDQGSVHIDDLSAINKLNDIQNKINRYEKFIHKEYKNTGKTPYKLVANYAENLYYLKSMNQNPIFFEMNLNNFDFKNETKLVNIVNNMVDFKSKNQDNPFTYLKMDNLNKSRFNDLISTISICDKYIESYIKFKERYGINNPKLLNSDNFADLMCLVDKPAVIDNLKDLEMIIKNAETYQDILCGESLEDFNNTLEGKLNNCQKDINSYLSSLKDFKKLLDDLTNDLNQLKELCSKMGISTSQSFKEVLKSMSAADFIATKPVLINDEHNLELFLDNLKKHNDTLDKKSYDDALKEINIEFNNIKKEITNKISDYSKMKSDILSLKELINNTCDMQNNFGISQFNLGELDNVLEKCDILTKNPVFINDNDELNSFLLDVQKYQDIAANETSSVLIKNLNEVGKNILNDLNDLKKLNNNFNKLIGYLDEVIEFKNEFGLVSFNSMADLNQVLEDCEILKKNPAYIDNNDDFDDIIRILTEFKYKDFNNLNSFINSFEIINQEFKLSTENLVISNISNLQIYVNELLKYLDIISELANCVKITNLKSIDKYIEDISVLFKNPMYIKDKSKLDLLIDVLIDYQNDPNLFDCNSYELQKELKDINKQLNGLPFTSGLKYTPELSDMAENFRECLEFMELPEIINLDNLSNLDEKFEKVSKVEHSILRGISRKLFGNEEYERYLEEFKRCYKGDVDFKEEIEGDMDNLLETRIELKEIHEKLDKYYTSSFNDWSLLSNFESFIELSQKRNYISDLLERINNSREKIRAYKNWNNESKLLKEYFPNIFNDFETDIDKLNKEYEVYKHYTQLIDDGFFKNNVSLNEVSSKKINKAIKKLYNTKLKCFKLINKINNEFSCGDTFLDRKNIFALDFTILTENIISVKKTVNLINEFNKSNNISHQYNASNVKNLINSANKFYEILTDKNIEFFLNPSNLIYKLDIINSEFNLYDKFFNMEEKLKTDERIPIEFRKDNLNNDAIIDYLKTSSKFMEFFDKKVFSQKTKYLVKVFNSKEITNKLNHISIIDKYVRYNYLINRLPIESKNSFVQVEFEKSKEVLTEFVKQIENIDEIVNKLNDVNLDIYEFNEIEQYFLELNDLITIKNYAKFDSKLMNYEDKLYSIKKILDYLPNLTSFKEKIESNQNIIDKYFKEVWEGVPTPFSKLTEINNINITYTNLVKNNFFSQSTNHYLKVNDVNKIREDLKIFKNNFKIINDKLNNILKGTNISRFNLKQHITNLDNVLKVIYESNKLSVDLNNSKDIVKENKTWKDVLSEINNLNKKFMENISNEYLLKIGDLKFDKNLDNIQSNINYISDNLDLEDKLLNDKLIQEVYFKDIWKGLNTPYDVLNERVENCKEFTKLYDNRIISKNTISYLSAVSLENLTRDLSNFKKSLKIINNKLNNNVFSKKKYLNDSSNVYSLQKKISDLMNSSNKLCDKFNKIDFNSIDLSLVEGIEKSNVSAILDIDIGYIKESLFDLEYYNSDMSILNSVLNETNKKNNLINNHFSDIWNGLETPIDDLNKKLNSDKEFTVLMKNNFFNDNIFDVIKMDSNTIESDITKNKALVSDIEKQLNSILDLGYENKNYFKGDLKETQKEISFLNKNTQKLKDLYEYTHYLIDNNNENTKDIINLVKSKDCNLKCILPILKLNISNNLLKSIITKYPQLNKDNIEILINELSHVNKLNENLIDINRNRIVNLTVDRIDVDLIENNINQNDNLKKQFIDLTKLGPVNSKLYPVGRVLSDSCDIITKIKACFIVNPSMVPKYLDLNDFKSKFDYVIIDDPENMEINEIISALARGKHHVFVSKVNDNSKIKSINIKNKLLIRSLKHVDVDYGKLSSFDEVIYDLLTNKGVSVKKQVKSDKNRIDLAIYDKKKCKLEIESDDYSEYNKRLLTERFGLNKSDKYYKLWAFDWYHNIDEVEKTLFN